MWLVISIGSSDYVACDLHREVMWLVISIGRSDFYVACDSIGKSDFYVACDSIGRLDFYVACDLHREVRSLLGPGHFSTCLY